MHLQGANYKVHGFNLKLFKTMFKVLGVVQNECSLTKAPEAEDRLRESKKGKTNRV